jgi:ABC-type molybdate transport system substrate-binding protein
MIQTSLAKRIALIAAGGLMSCLFAAVASSAAEIKVLTSVALTSAFNELAPNFEQATGNKLNIGYSLIADIRKRILDGETADVIILSRPVMDELDKQQKFASGSITNVARTPVALAIRAGATKPDISTVDALKRTLLAAKSIVYADPAKGGASGVYFAKIVDRLGITDQLKSKNFGPGSWCWKGVVAARSSAPMDWGSDRRPLCFGHPPQHAALFKGLSTARVGGLAAEQGTEGHFVGLVWIELALQDWLVRGPAVYQLTSKALADLNRGIQNSNR